MLLEQRGAETFDAAQRGAQVVGDGIAERFQLLVDDGELRGVRGVPRALGLGVAQRGLNDFDGAEATYKKAISVDSYTISVPSRYR